MPPRKGTDEYNKWKNSPAYDKFCKKWSEKRKIQFSISCKEAFKNGDRISWMKGLTVETDERIANLGRAISKATKGRVRSKTHCLNLSKAMTPERRAAYSRRMKENNPMKNPETAKKQSQSISGERHCFYGKKRPDHSKIISKKMREGQAVYMQSKITTSSKPQKELFKICQKVFPYAIMNYSHYCGEYTFSIDIAVPQLSLAIEYDGSYWHKNKRTEHWRQKILESVGWYFLRYSDRVPSALELLSDYNNLDVGKILD